MQKKKVFHLDKLPEDQKKMWQERAEPMGFEFDCANTDDLGAVKKQIKDAEYLIVKKAVLAEELLDAAPGLKLVQLEGRLADKIPVAELHRRGIAFDVAGLPSTISVAEHAAAVTAPRLSGPPVRPPPAAPRNSVTRPVQFTEPDMTASSTK